MQDPQFFINNFFEPLVFYSWVKYKLDLTEFLSNLVEVKSGKLEHFDMMFDNKDNTFFIIGKNWEYGYEDFLIEDISAISPIAAIYNYYPIYRYKH
jgi:hypothetical protein